ncbi:MAG TPA: VOC family protein [Gemmatimonadales bacterium]|nr:VOC family protein [Gemmatimonadales bacterium]
MIEAIGADSLAPAGWHTVTPRIVAHNASGLIEFLLYVFRAAGAHDPASPSIIEIGDSKIMVSEAGPRGARMAFLYVYVSDLDSAYRRALECGATSIEEPFDTPYGDRRCMIEDKWGNTWQIAVHKASRDAT